MINNDFNSDDNFVNQTNRYTVCHDERIALIDYPNETDVSNLRYPIKTDAFLIVLCSRGEITFNINNNKYTARENNLVICHPQCIFQKNNISDDFECYGFCISPEFAKQIFLVSSNNWKTRIFVENHPIINIEKDERMIFRQYYDLLRSKLVSKHHLHKRELISSLLQAFVYEMHDSLYEAFKKEPNSFNSPSNIFNSFLNLIVSTYPKERSVSYYADKLFITSKYLTAVCKEISGETALAIITKYVVQDIEFLLRSPNKSIKQIANELNFPNISFFGKYVKRSLGVSPKEYREHFLRNTIL